LRVVRILPVKENHRHQLTFLLFGAFPHIMSAHENDSEMADAVKYLDTVESTTKSGNPALTVIPARDVYHSATSTYIQGIRFLPNSTVISVEKKGEQYARSKLPNPHYVDKSHIQKPQPPVKNERNFGRAG
jgi:hypothetical protein